MIDKGVLGEIVADERTAGKRQILSRGSAVDQIRVPDQDVAFAGMEVMRFKGILLNQVADVRFVTARSLLSETLLR